MFTYQEAKDCKSFLGAGKNFENPQIGLSGIRISKRVIKKTVPNIDLKNLKFITITTMNLP